MGCYSSKELRPSIEENSGGSPNLGGVDKEALEQSKKALRSLLTAKNRDFLVDKFGKKVKVDQLKGHTIGLLFSAHAVPSAREFILVLGEVHKELRSRNRPFEVVFLSNDESLEIWKESMKEMPWLAVPFSDRETGDNLGAQFGISDIPTLVIIDPDGNKVTGEGVEIIQSFGAKAWPFSTETLGTLRSAEPLDREQGKPLGELNSKAAAERTEMVMSGTGSMKSNHEAPRDSQVAPETYE